MKTTTTTETETITAPDPIIRNAKDLAKWIGVDYDEDSTEEYLGKAMSRRLYKDTSCGAWLSLARMEDCEKPVIWTAHLKKGIDGVYVTRARRAHGKTTTDIASLPERVRQFLLLFAHSNKTELTPDCFDTLSAISVSNGDATKRVTAKSPIEKIVTFSLKEMIYVNGVAIGSIVEGTDATTSVHELAFPFLLSDFWAAVQKVEDEASEIWNETHGCDTCEAHWMEESENGEGLEGIYGGIPVWVECPDCGGGGAII